MNHLNGKPIAPTDIKICPNWKPTPDNQGWEMPMSASIGFLSKQWPTPDISLPGVNPASVQSAEHPPMMGLDTLPSLEAQLYAIISSLYDSNEVRRQLGADEYIPPPPPVDPVDPVDPEQPIE